jgi:ketosteroid isomerase-like protein
MASERVQKLAAAYDLWERSRGGSIDHWLSLMADEVDFRSLADDLPQATFAQPYKRREDVRKYLEGLVAGWEMLSYRVDRFVEQGDDVVMIGSTAWRNRATGKMAETTKVDLWRFQGDKAVAFFELLDTAKVAACCTPD